jgi:hypothetical protein
LIAITAVILLHPSNPAQDYPCLDASSLLKYNTPIGEPEKKCPTLERCRDGVLQRRGRNTARGHLGGWTARRLADHFGVSTQAIQNRKRKLGLTEPRKAKKRGDRVGDYIDASTSVLHG